MLVHLQGPWSFLLGRNRQKAIPYDNVIILLAFGLAPLAVILPILDFKKLPSLWREWLMTVDLQEISVFQSTAPSGDFESRPPAQEKLFYGSQPWQRFSSREDRCINFRVGSPSQRLSVVSLGALEHYFVPGTAVPSRLMRGLVPPVTLGRAPSHFVTSR